MAATAASRLLVGKLTQSARQQSCRVERPRVCVGANRRVICQAAFPQSSSPGSEPLGSDAFPWEDLFKLLQENDARLQDILATQEEQGKIVDALTHAQRDMQTIQEEQRRDIGALTRAQRDMQTTQEEQVRALDALKRAQRETLAMQAAHRETLCALEHAQQKMAEDVVDAEEGIKSVQAAQAMQGEVFNAIVDKAVRVEHALTGQDFQLPRSMEITTGRDGLGGRRAAYEPPTSTRNSKAVAGAGKLTRTFGDNVSKGP